MGVGDFENNDVSHRSHNVLRRLGIQSFRELAEADYHEIKDARGIGNRSVNEMLAIIKERTKLQSQRRVDVNDPEKINKLVDKIGTFISDCIDREFDETTRTLLFNSVANHCVDSTGNVAIDEEKVRDIFHSEEIKELVKGSIYAKAGDKVYAQVTFDDIKKLFYKFNRIDNDYVADILREMIAAKMIMEKNGFVYKYKMPFHDWLLKLNKKEKMAVGLRCKGCTLEEVGHELGVTRERARQIISKSLRKRPKLFEDGYKQLFEKYSFTDREFEVLLGVNYEVINYLKLVCEKNTICNDVQELIADDELPQICKERAAEAFKDTFLFVSGELLPLKREAVFEWVIKKHYSDSDCTITELESVYYDFLEENGLQNNEKLKFPSSRAFEGRVTDYPYCVLKYGKRVRYYDIDALDMNMIANMLNLERYEGLEISTLKLFIDNVDDFEELDIRDEYELHNILRKQSAYLRQWNVTIERMPFISIGKADRFKQVRELLYQLAPISKEDLAMEYEMRYGVKKETVLANFLGEIDVYLSNGIFDINQPELSILEFKQMEDLLVDDIYMWDEIVGLYEKTIGGGRIEAINAMTLKQLGFKVFSEYVIRNTYPSADAFFTELLLKNNQIDVSKLKSGVRSIQAYYGSLCNLRDKLELIEIEKDHFVRFDFFSENIVECTKEDLRDIGRRILCSRTAEVFSVKNNDVSDSINRFARIINNVYFINSIVRVQKAVKTNIMGNLCVIAKNGRDASLHGMMMELLRNKKTYEIGALVDAVYDTFGVSLDKHKVVHFLSQDETVEVDSIMGIVRMIDKSQIEIGEKAFWINTPYEETITEVKSEIEGSKATICGIYWKEQYRFFAEKCKEKELVLMKDLVSKDIERLCEKMRITRTMTSDIIHVYISWAKELKEKKENDAEDILSFFFR